MDICPEHVFSICSDPKPRVSSASALIPDLGWADKVQGLIPAQNLISELTILEKTHALLGYSNSTLEEKDDLKKPEQRDGLFNSTR